MVQTVSETQVATFAPPVNIVEVARRYITTQVGANFTITKPRLLNGKNVWWALIQYQASGASRPIGVGQLQIEAKTGTVIPLTRDEIRVVREKATLLEAKHRGKLPIDAQGFVLAEFARKQASRYLWDNLGMYYAAIDPIFVPENPPGWQISIVFKRYEEGPFYLGVMVVDAQSGQPIPLTEIEIKQIKERVHAIVGPQTSSTKAG